jgi:hypothetical protein
MSVASAGRPTRQRERRQTARSRRTHLRRTSAGASIPLAARESPRAVGQDEDRLLPSRTGGDRTAESVAQDRNLGLGIGAENRDHVEPAGRRTEMVPHEVGLCRSKDAPLFLLRDGFRRVAVRHTATAFHFDEAESSRLLRDEINFAGARDVVALEDLVAGRLEVTFGETLPLLSASAETFVCAPTLEKLDESIQENSRKHSTV